MNVFYEEEGSFKVASVMTENPGSLQVESVSGKRSKIKTANVLLKFDGTLAGFMDKAQAEADTLATARLNELSGAFIQAEGVALRRPDIRAGRRGRSQELVKVR